MIGDNLVERFPTVLLLEVLEPTYSRCAILRSDCVQQRQVVTVSAVEFVRRLDEEHARSGRLRRRDIFLRIEPLVGYSPLAPIVGSRRYGRDAMRGVGHEVGRVQPEEIAAATVDALVYREYLDDHYLVPNTAKIVESDVNEPPWYRRVPGAVLYAEPGERLYIHVLNADPHDCHSLHVHGVQYGIDSDGAWPLGIGTRLGRRSDEIRPGDSW